MPGNTSFYYAIFKKFQAAAGNIFALGQEHFAPEASNDVAGGFSLRAADDPDGVTGALSSQATMYGYTPGWRPINPNSTVPTDSPLYVMLHTSLGPMPVPSSVVVNGQTWPVMPPPVNGSIASHPDWLEFNNANAVPKLIDAFADWIAKGKANDCPKNAPLTSAALSASPPKAWPNLGNKVTPILFVASMAGDDGRRHKDGGSPDVVLDHVPANFWATSQIFLTDASGATVNPAHLDAGQEYYVAAILGNAGNAGAGRTAQGPKIHVLGDALAFNTFLSPGTPLPALSNLDPADTNPTYEQYLLRAQSTDVAGFRFNVDAVFGGLKQALIANAVDLNGATPEDWLKQSHACVKIRVTSGEPANTFPPDGGAALTLDSDPRKDRHIAQRNLAPFDMALMGAKKILWKNFIVAQAGTGPNGLTLQHGLPSAAFQLYVAVPRRVYDLYIDPKGSKGAGAVRGFELVREAPEPKPFPGDTVILRQTSPAASIHVAEHRRERFLGMALGLEGDPAKLRGVRLTDVSIAHATHDGGIVGGFTLRPSVMR